MKNINRRAFIGKLAIGAGAVTIFSRLPGDLLNYAKANKIAVGFQTWPVREALSKDFAGTLKMMKDMGYEVMEMCSPKGYVNAGFGPLVNMKVSDMRKTITDTGLTCPSCHFGLGELVDNTDDRISFAKELGLSEMICSSFGLPDTAHLSDYTTAAEKLNKAAVKIRDAGMQAGFHNHQGEFAQLDGKLIYDELMNTFDPALVKMQFQTEVINLGYKGADYFRKYPGRFVSSHLSDWSADKKPKAIGQGVIDWKDFFEAAKVGGVKRFLVEMDVEFFKDSAVYLHGLK